MLPDFNKMTTKEVKEYIHQPIRRICIKCHGKKEQHNGNAYYCNACLDKQNIEQNRLKQSQAQFAQFADMHPDLSFKELVTLYEAR
jgi:hypothetical protein